MKEETNFIDELIRESEERDKKLEHSHLDLILIEIRKLEDEVEKNFDTAAQEREIIKNWALERNSMLSSRIEWLSRKLELYLKEEDLKTLDLPNGIIRIRKQPEKISVIDEEKSAAGELCHLITFPVYPVNVRVELLVPEQTVADPDTVPPTLDGSTINAPDTALVTVPHKPETTQ